MNKFGKVLLTVSSLSLIIIFYFLLFDESKLAFIPDGPLMAILVVFDIVCFSSSFALIYLFSDLKKQKRIITILSIISTIIFSFGILSKLNYWPGASIELIISILLFVFSSLPIIVRIRYQKRIKIITRYTLLLSIADLFAVMLICLSLLSKFMHWPGASIMLVLGLAFLTIAFIGWNSSFKREVSLRQIAEQKVRDTLLEVEEKNKEITDSINYAKRIQKAILPSFEFIQNHLPKSYIYYQPKDIVAGDFYWAEKINDTFFIAAADCTGHGVPGALLSVVCSNALNRSVKEFNLTEPGKILDKTRELLLESFSKSGESIKDGMDISLVSINKDIIKWAGANNPLWYIKNSEFHEIKADKQPIGASSKNEAFTTHTLQLNAGDTLYLFTDGYADQFGGTNGKKFKYKPFAELLLSTHHLNLKDQFEKVISTIQTWKGNLEQVDDICVVGIRL